MRALQMSTGCELMTATAAPVTATDEDTAAATTDEDTEAKAHSAQQLSVTSEQQKTQNF